ncbi:MAG TPA: tRNA adenosine(34) deaminase TadA [Terriglobia bacterium]|nr:tRNA adenosine(34) deaminase TadA [Terriglobia bacterium]
MDITPDEKFMDIALDEAHRAEKSGEVPVGAVIVNADGNIVARGFNQPISIHDPTAHAEIIAIRAAARILGNYRLTGLTLYCTMEPCVMCAGAIVHARIQRLVFGAADPRAGAAGSIYDVVSDARLNHQVKVVAGVRERECREIVQNFFEKKRA